MSGVAMLKVRGAKRVFDEMAVDLPVTSNSCSPARFPLRPLKRGRCNPSQPSSVKPTPSPSAMASLATPTPSRVAVKPSVSLQTGQTGQTGSQTASQGTSGVQKLSEDELAALARHVPKRLKRVVERMSAGQVAVTDKVFTVNDLREIIASVLAEREGKLSEEFARVLHERLAEQFRDFTKFNEDYVARQLRGRDFAYLS